MPTAMLFDGPGKPLRAEAFPVPTPGPGEAVVRIRLCTLCGSDLHTFFGRRSEPTPVILGHEMVGEVERVHATELPCDLAGEPLRVGDRVTWSVCGSCGGCFYCTHNLPQKCDTLFKYGKRTGGLFGGLATHCHLLPGTSVVKLPDGLPDEVAAPAMCATATAAACLRAAGGVSGKTVRVYGGGLLGLSAAAMANAGGVAVEVIDTNPERVALAKRFGASFPPSPHADCAFDFTGSPAAIEQALASVRTGGTVILAGSVFPTPPIALHPEEVVKRCLTIVGVHNYAPRDLQTAVRFLADHHTRFPFAELVSRTFPLADAEAAFHFAEQERPIRVGVRP